MKKGTVSRAAFYRDFKDKYDVMSATYKSLLDYYVNASHYWWLADRKPAAEKKQPAIQF